MTAILQDLEPGVIDTAMIMKSLEEERPTGEAGRLAAEEGIVLRDVKRLRLEFLNILKIDHLWMMTSLVKLHLGNNIIEKIEGLDALINLKELDLSFNNIEVIENLDVLEKLEILTLFENRIHKIENMEKLVNLMIFSIGNNKIRDKNEVIYLRQFPVLSSLNMAGNPCAGDEETDFRQYVCAFLPKLTYYEYRIISSEERQKANGEYRSVLEQIEEKEGKLRQSKEEEAARNKELAFHAEAYVENLDGDYLFLDMFENDVDGNALLKIGTAAEELYDKFHDETTTVLKEIFKIGLEHHDIREEEIKQFQKCVDAAKEDDRVASQEYMEQFLEKKADIFLKIRKLLLAVEEMSSNGDTSQKGEYLIKMQELTNDFREQSQTAWYKLMSQELTLFEQLEDMNGNFERNMNDLVSVFIEAAQSLFVQIRNFEASFNEEIAEVANSYLADLNISPVPVPPELEHIMIDKESLNSATTQSHDVHVQILDAREDQLMSRIRKWVEEYCEDIHKKEIERSRKKIIEINHFLDVQREEFEEFSNFQLELPDSETASEMAAAESTHEEEVSSAEGATATDAGEAQEGEEATEGENVEERVEEDKPPDEDKDKQGGGEEAAPAPTN